MTQEDFSKLKLAIFILFLPLFLKLFHLQVIRGDYFYSRAQEQQRRYLEVSGQRGKIFDSRGRIMAMDRNYYSVFINPRQVSEKEEVAHKLSRVLGKDFQTVFTRLQRDSYFAWLRRGLGEEILQDLESLDIPGLGVRVERRRIYPQNELSAQVLGAVDVDNKGIAGLEFYYDDILRDSPGYRTTFIDGRNVYLDNFQHKYAPPSDGKSLVLTIDQVLQFYAEEEAERLYQNYNARGVSIVVMDSRGGGILALANRPSYNPNRIRPQDLQRMRNIAVSDSFEPGSVLKVVAAAALLEENLVELEEEFYCEKGFHRIGGRPLRDYRHHGWLDFKSVIANSSNIGVAKAVSRIEEADFYRYLRLFGIGEKSGLDLPGETNGILRDPSAWTDYSKISLAMGQEVAVNTIQLARMMSIIANGGYQVQPHIVREIRDQNNIRIKSISGKSSERVLSPAVADAMRATLAAVVERGTGRNAASVFYSAGGKTGTGQKADPVKGGYSDSKYVATFAGFLPLDDPSMVIVVVVDEPRPAYFGGVVAAPAFRKIAERSLVYLSLLEEEREADYEAQPSFVRN